MSKPFADKRIGVLMGGKSGEREVSLRSGKGVLASLIRQGYDAVGIDVDEKVDIKIREEKIDVAFIAMHGTGGEDGKIQGLLETLEIPYTGSGVTASALAMDKELTKLVLGLHGLPFPETVYLNRGDDPSEKTAEIKKKLGLPVMLKPAAEGSSLGCALVKEEGALEAEVAKILKGFAKSLAEPFIKGYEITVGVLGAGKNIRALPVLQMIPKNEYYDYEAKYTKGMTELICPARMSPGLTAISQDIAVKAHRALGCYGASRVDFIAVEPDRVYILEVNSIPGMTETSDLPEEICAEGGSYDTLVLEILSTATLDR